MMVVIAVCCLAAGVLLGNGILPKDIIDFLTGHSEHVLYVLMFSVGISVGANKGVFQKLREHHVKILLIPIGVILGSIFGGVVCSLFLGESLRDSLMIVSGLGWYSLSGVLVTELAGAKIGTIAFLCNLLREIFSFMIIPVVVKYFNGYAAIAPAAATSEDTTLPMLMKYTSGEVVMMDWESRLFNVHIQYSGIFAAIQLHYGKKIRRKIQYAERLLQIHGYV